MYNLFTINLPDDFDLQVDMCEVCFVNRKTGYEFQMDYKQFKCITRNQDLISDTMLKLSPFKSSADWPSQFYLDIGEGMHVKIENEPLMVITNKSGDFIKLTLNDYSVITYFTDLMSLYSVTLRD